MGHRTGSGGVLGASAATWIATTPSLLPRTWWMWAANIALSQVYGYAFGAGAEAVGRAGAEAVGRAARGRREPKVPGHGVASGRVGAEAVGRAGRGRPEPKVPGHGVTSGRVASLLLVGITTYSWARGARRQREVSELLGLPPEPARTHVIGALVGTGMSAAAVLSTRAAIDLSRGLRATMDRGFGATARQALGATRGNGSTTVPRSSRMLSTAATVGIGGLVVGGAAVVGSALRRAAFGRARSRAERLNAFVSPALAPPVSPLRSAGPGSAETWAGIGAAGRRIIAGGLDARAIGRAIGRPALEPIRVYVGDRPGRDLDGAVAAALAELDRTGAFDREVLVLFTGTGTGWLQEWSISAVELLTGGDCACAAIQYTVLSSALATLTDRGMSREAGRRLFEAVSARRDALPSDRRPRLMVSGESLGAYGGHGAFADLDDMLARTDGAVWTGTPAFTPILADLVRRRPRGSAAVAPRVDDGRHVRVVTSDAELAVDVTGHRFGTWEHPRIVYLQHASDPVARWSPDLLWRAPAWMRERIGHDVTPAMRWFPWITFWQVAADMPLSITMPAGHGHAYREELVAVWAAVLGLDPAEDRGAIIAAIRDGALPGV